MPSVRLGGHPHLMLLMTKGVENNAAYRCGWIDGRYEESCCFTENRRLAELVVPAERLDYYRGHRDGREARVESGRIRKAA